MYLTTADYLDEEICSVVVPLPFFKSTMPKRGFSLDQKTRSDAKKTTTKELVIHKTFKDLTSKSLMCPNIKHLGICCAFQPKLEECPRLHSWREVEKKGGDIEGFHSHNCYNLRGWYLSKNIIWWWLCITILICFCCTSFLSLSHSSLLELCVAGTICVSD